MKIIDFNGREHSWPPKGCKVDLNDKRPRSSLHLRCRALLHAMYPTRQILEEVPLPGTNLRLDFYLPHRDLAVECQGQQHTKFNPFYHGDKASFMRAKANDHKKREYCRMNNIEVIELNHDESNDEWRDKING